MAKRDPSRPFQLFRKPRSDIWHVRYTIRGHGQQRQTTGETDQGQAYGAAMRIYMDAVNRAKEGLGFKPLNVGHISDRFIKHEKEQVDLGNLSANRQHLRAVDVERFVKPFLAERGIDSLRANDLDAFRNFVKGYWVKGPGKAVKCIDAKRAGKPIKVRPKRKLLSVSTINRIERELLMVLNFAADGRHISPSQVPRRPRREGAQVRRASFSDAEFARLMQHLSNRVADAAMHLPRVERDRIKLLCFCGMAAFSGIRPGILMRLRWGDIEGFAPDPEVEIDEDGMPILDPNGPLRNRLTIRVVGKGKIGQAIPLRQFEDYLSKLHRVFVAEVGRPPGPDDPVFSHSDGVPIASFNHSFGRVLDELGLRKDKNGLARTAYSFRHLYVTRSLEEDIPMQVVAANCATSLEMIQRYYDHSEIERHRAKLERESGIPHDPIGIESDFVIAPE
jgi:integrase